jgi:hypothetical protein
MMTIQGLNEFLKEKQTTSRVYFSSKIPNRQKIIDESTKIIPELSKEVSTIFTHYKFIVCYNNDNLVHIFRGNKGNSVLEYVPSYLINSLLLNVMFVDTMSMKEKLDQVVFIWYYHQFMKTNKDITDLTHRVCFQLEEMIKTVIEKEVTIYRNYDTSEIVAALRGRLSSERLVNMGVGKTKNVKFR